MSTFQKFDKLYQFSHVIHLKKLFVVLSFYHKISFLMLPKVKHLLHIFPSPDNYTKNSILHFSTVWSSIRELHGTIN